MHLLLILGLCALPTNTQNPPSETPPIAAVPSPAEADKRTAPEWVYHPPDKQAFVSHRASADPVLAAMIQSPNPRVRQDAVEGLEATKSQKTVDICLVCLGDPDRGVCDAAVRTLLAQDPDLLARRMLDGLASGRADLWKGIASALPRLRKPIETRMIDILSEKKADPWRRMLAAYSLGTMHSRRAMQPLRELAWSGVPGVSGYCAQALAALNDPAALRDVAELAGHPESEVRLAAVSALGRAGGSVARKALELVVASPNEPDIAVRGEAVRLLGIVGGASSVPVLIEAMRQHRGVADKAAESLKQLTGLDFGDKPDRWSDWYLRQLQARGLAPSTIQPQAVDLSEGRE
ncbi:MAG: HEAT repeat domain-containing protein [bacterium]|nr:HEAT repeat domain-containing protein [bacterium]